MKKKEFELQLMLMGFSKRYSELDSEVYERQPDFDIWKSTNQSHYALYDTPGKEDRQGSHRKEFKSRKAILKYINQHTYRPKNEHNHKRTTTAE